MTKEGKKDSLDKLGSAIRLSFPVIRLETFELERAKKVTKEAAKEVGKGFFVMKFNEVPLPRVFEGEARKYQKGLVVFDPFFHIRAKVRNDQLAALISSINWLEKNGVNYVIPGLDSLNHEFVYNITLPGIAEGEAIKILEESEKSVKAGVFDREEKRAVARTALGLSYMQMKNVFTMAAYLRYKGKEYMESVRAEKRYLLRDYGIDVLEGVSVEEVGGLDNVKEFLKVRKAGFDKNLPVKGILLAGLPGGGKTLIARATSSVFGTALVQLDMGRFYSKYVGETEERFRKALRVIEQIAPVTVLIDEMEKYFGTGEGQHEVSKRLLGTFLFWLQERKEKIFIVGTVNRINQMPVELMRTGRWDRQFFIDLPNSEERRAIVRIHAEKHGVEISGEALERVVKETEDFTGAEIEQAILDAVFSANYKEKPATADDVTLAVAGISPISRTRRDDVDAIRALRKQGFAPASRSEDSEGESGGDRKIA